MLSAFLTEVVGGDGGTLASHCRDLNKIYCPELQQADGGAIAGVFLLQKEQEACDFRRLRLTSDTELAVGEGRERKEKKKKGSEMWRDATWENELMRHQLCDSTVEQCF